MAITLKLVVHLFLERLKLFDYPKYVKNKRMITWYSLIIAISMLLRVGSLVMDTIVQRVDPPDEDSAITKVNDIIMMAFYFIEMTPSVIIIIVLWKSNKELRYKHYPNLGKFGSFEPQKSAVSASLIAIKLDNCRMQKLSDLVCRF